MVLVLVLWCRWLSLFWCRHWNILLEILRGFPLALFLLCYVFYIIKKKEYYHHFTPKTVFIFDCNLSIFDSSFLTSTTFVFRPWSGECLVYFFDFGLKDERYLGWLCPLYEMNWSMVKLDSAYLDLFLFCFGALFSLFYFIFSFLSFYGPF